MAYCRTAAPGCRSTPAVLLVLIGLHAGVADGQNFTVPEKPFAELTGPHQVGTADYFWVDEARAEPYTSDPNDKRHLLVKVWYPAEVPDDAQRAPYLPCQDEFEDKALFAPAASLMSRSYLDVPLAGYTEKYPLLIYSHGGSWTRFSASFQTEALAGAGYVVVAIGHTGFNKSTKFPDGYEFKNDALPFPESTDNVRESALRQWAYLGGPVSELWHGDATFVLNKLAEINAAKNGLFAGRLDLDRTGMFGWSFGGSLAIQMTKDDPRIRAAVDQDGQLFGNVRDTGAARPFMLMHSPMVSANPDDDPVLAGLIEMVEGWDKTLLKKSTADWFDIVIGKATHGHFSDLTLFTPAPPSQIDPARAHAIILEFTLAFFDRYLRGKESRLLDGATAGYPEVRFRSSKKTE